MKNEYNEYRSYESPSNSYQSYSSYQDYSDYDGSEYHNNIKNKSEKMNYIDLSENLINQKYKEDGKYLKYNGFGENPETSNVIHDGYSNDNILRSYQDYSDYDGYEYHNNIKNKSERIKNEYVEIFYTKNELRKLKNPPTWFKKIMLNWFSKSIAILSEEEKKINFFIKNEMFIEIENLKDSGYILNDLQQTELIKKMQESILKDSDKFIKTYIKENREISENILIFCFLIEMQKKQISDSNSISINSFINKVNKALDVDGVNKYKNKKLNDKDFVTKMFNVWGDILETQITDIEKNVINKTHFLFIEQKKNSKKMGQDIVDFHNNRLPKCILQGEYFFTIPLLNNCFDKHISVSDLIQMQDFYQRLKEITTTANDDEFCYALKVINYSSIDKVYDIIIDRIKNPIVKEVDSYSGEIINKESGKNNKPSTKIEERKKNELSKETLQTISEISSLSDLLYQQSITQETKEIIDFITKEKVPEIIQDYLNIDYKYRSNLRNIEGKDAQQLIKESLFVIHESLKNVEKDIHEENLKKLSINTRYIKKRFA